MAWPFYTPAVRRLSKAGRSILGRVLGRVECGPGSMLSCGAMDSEKNTENRNAFDVLEERGFVSQVTDREAVRAALGQGPVTFYVGFDPTAASLHVGSMVPLMAMANLQRLGHRPIFILGGGTAMVGDPSGKSEMRKMLTREQIASNGEGLKRQFERFCSLEGGGGLMLDNAEWLLPLNYVEFLRDIGRHFSVNRMLSHESYKIRLERGLSFLEFNYQLLQAYDFLTLFQRHACLMQMGADDQWGNIVAGMDLIRRLEAKEAHGLTFPLLATASGEKMGKTARGAVWLDGALTSPHDFFQYFRNADDRDVERFLKLFTFLPMDRVRELAGLQGQQINAAKVVLAYCVTEIVHGTDKAMTALTETRSLHVGDPAIAAALDFLGLETRMGASTEEASMTSTCYTSQRIGEGLLVVDAFLDGKLVKSKGEARRKISEGGLRVGERVVKSHEEKISLDEFKDGKLVIWFGKKKPHLIIIKDD
jgi:tyrosyl-tRNA synthetase